MSPGLAAGLALLTLCLAPLAHAQNVSVVSDQQLGYYGTGWVSSNGPQECAGISRSVHSTNNLGDTVALSFIGNAVFVHGPFVPGQNPLTIVLDNAIQNVSSPTHDESGCGTLYSNPRINNNLQPHILTMKFTNPSGSSTFSISGMTFYTIPSNSATGLLNTSPTSMSSATLPNATSTSSTQHVDYSPTSSAPAVATSIIDTSTSKNSTTRRMAVGLIGAVVGSVFGMIGLLVLFMFVRRSITRMSVRQSNQQDDFGRGHDVENGHGKTLLVDHAGIYAFSSDPLTGSNQSLGVKNATKYPGDVGSALTHSDMHPLPPLPSTSPPHR